MPDELLKAKIVNELKDWSRVIWKETNDYMLSDEADAILAIFAEERKEYTEDGYCYFRDKWEESKAREAKLVELLGRLRDYLNEVNDDHRYYSDDTEPLIDEIDAALAVKEGK